MRKSKKTSLNPKFSLEKIENIEDYFISVENEYPKFTELQGVFEILISELDIINSEDSDFLHDEFLAVFGPEPDDKGQINEFYESSSAGISFNILESSEPIFSIRLTFDLRNKLLDFTNPIIEIQKDENLFVELIKEIKSRLKIKLKT